MAETDEPYLTIRELDAHLLEGRRIDATFAGKHIVACQLEGLSARVPPALFKIYLHNGLIARDNGKGFAATPLGRSRLRWR